MYIKVLLKAAFLMLALSSCATVTKQLGFQDLGVQTEERIGKTIYWNQGTEADKSTRTKITELLSRKLEAADAVQIALLNNRNLQATYEELNIAQSDFVEAGLLSNPIFDAELRFHRGGGLSLEAAVVQNFIDIIFLSLRKKVASAAFESAKLRVLKGIIDLASNVERKFYNYQASEENLLLTKDLLTAAHTSLTIAEQLRKAGNIRELDLANQKSLWEGSRIELRQAEADVVNARQALNALMGVWGDDAKWKGVTRFPNLPGSLYKDINIEELVLKRSLDLGILKSEINEAATSLGIAKPLGILSGVEAGASAEREAESGEWGVGPAFSFPIPILNQGQPSILRAGSILKAKQENYEGAAISLKAKVKSEMGNLEALRDEIGFYKTGLMPLKAKIVKESQLQYNAMQMGAADLIAAKQEEMEAAAKYLMARRKFWETKANLDQLLSGSMGTVENEGTDR